jgi:hypothetical protein
MFNEGTSLTALTVKVIESEFVNEPSETVNVIVSCPLKLELGNNET